VAAEESGPTEEKKVDASLAGNSAEAEMVGRARRGGGGITRGQNQQLMKGREREGLRLERNKLSSVTAVIASARQTRTDRDSEKRKTHTERRK
jgi:hypothetical protein